jgi:hypothetical protein
MGSGTCWLFAACSRSASRSTGDAKASSSVTFGCGACCEAVTASVPETLLPRLRLSLLELPSSRFAVLSRVAPGREKEDSRSFAADTARAMADGFLALVSVNSAMLDCD